MTNAAPVDTMIVRELRELLSHEQDNAIVTVNGQALSSSAATDHRPGRPVVKLAFRDARTMPVARRWVPRVPRNASVGERSSKHIIEWIRAHGGSARRVIPDVLLPHDVGYIRITDVGELHPGEWVVYDNGEFSIKKVL